MLRAKFNASRFLPALLATLAVTACDQDTLGVEDEGTLAEEGKAIVRILLTDAPSDYIASASVDIGAVELVPVDDGPHVLLSEDGTDGLVNLLELQNAATTPIAEAEIDPGTFAQLRLVIEDAWVELAEGYEFRDGSTSKYLKVPSGAQTGIKLNLSEDGSPDGVTIVPGETVLVLDFDVSQSYVLQGNPETPAGIHGVIFKPTLRVTAEDVAASISGTVTTSLDGVSVEGLVVTAEPLDGGTVVGYQTQTATALTAADGSYTVHFLVPGTYDVTVGLEPGLGTDPESRTVSLAHSENATGVDFDVIDVTGSISGVVSTELAGVDVDGLTVTATPSDTTMDATTATTAGGGLYTLESLVPGAYTVTVEAGDDLLTDPAETVVAVGNSEDVTGVNFAVIQDVSGTISGTLTTAISGFALGGLTVTATPSAGGDAFTAETATDGTYTILSVAPGSYTVTVEVGTGFTTDPASRPVDLAADEEETGVDFAVIPAS